MRKASVEGKHCQPDNALKWKRFNPMPTSSCYLLSKVTTQYCAEKRRVQAILYIHLHGLNSKLDTV